MPFLGGGMTEEELKDFLNHLQGRIVALELLMRNVLATEVIKTSDPIRSLQQTKNVLFGSLQKAERPADETFDAIWSEAVEALKMTFDQTEIRLREFLERKS
jgi:hypothetical protein